jgi:hypothetical protein
MHHVGGSPHFVPADGEGSPNDYVSNLDRSANVIAAHRKLCAFQPENAQL